jgi:hypothetical protein
MAVTILPKTERRAASGECLRSGSNATRRDSKPDSRPSFRGAGLNAPALGWAARHDRRDSYQKTERLAGSVYVG